MAGELIIVGVSGGVDSSVAALLLKQAGRRVEAMFMKNWEDDGRFGECDADRDRLDALKVCAALDVPFHTRNFSGEYWDQVFTHFLAEYRAGRTPNPDVLCNREIKFRTFLDHARELGAGKIATGHYARTDCVDGRHRLLRGRDENKDQSYFLYALGQAQLAATEFPVGELPKPQVRALARDAALPTHAKKDSTGICFIGERDFRAFLSHYLPAQPGDMRTPDGVRVGEHPGVMYYTLGQRQGLGIGGRRDAAGDPWYVVGKDVAANVLYVAQGNANHWLDSHQLVGGDVSWTAGRAPSAEFRCGAKTRYRQADQSCTVHVADGRVDVVFDRAQRAATPGQSIVFYDGDECLGGAVIDATDAPYGGLAAAPISRMSA